MSGLPNEQEIRMIALEHLPEHYTLKGVTVTFGSDWQGTLPETFEIRIEFEVPFDKEDSSLDEIDAYQKWASALERKLRSKWPAQGLRIAFVSSISRTPSIPPQPS